MGIISETKTKIVLDEMVEPCPWCRINATLCVYVYEYEGTPDLYAVVCETCGGTGPQAENSGSAIEKFNAWKRNITIHESAPSNPT